MTTCTPVVVWNDFVKVIMDNDKLHAAYAPKIFVPRGETRDMFSAAVPVTGREFWRWGDNNMLPEALSLMYRRSTTHRRIINDKADYVAGKGFSYDDGLVKLPEFIGRVNRNGETLRQVLRKLALDKLLFGNAFLEVVTDSAGSFLSLFHQDASRCRLGRDGQSVMMHHNWRMFRPTEAEVLPLWPRMEEKADGKLHSVIHYRNYEPMFVHYGVPSYIAGMNVSAIAYKTDCWNISRLDNSFQLSGVMLLDGGVDNEEQAEELVRRAENRFAGKPGQVMFMIKDCGEGDSSRYIPITSSNEGDWKELHEQATSDIVVAHSWFRSLSGLDYSSGFNAERILHEYEVALNTVILSAQDELLEPVKGIMSKILGEDCSSLAVVNRPPTRSKPLYMKVWEARKADGLEYDPEDELQQLFVAQITKYAMRNID